MFIDYDDGDQETHALSRYVKLFGSPPAARNKQDPVISTPTVGTIPSLEDDFSWERDNDKAKQFASRHLCGSFGCTLPDKHAGLHNVSCNIGSRARRPTCRLAEDDWATARAAARAGRVPIGKDHQVAELPCLGSPVHEREDLLVQITLDMLHPANRLHHNAGGTLRRIEKKAKKAVVIRKKLAARCKAQDLPAQESLEAAAPEAFSCVKVPLEMGSPGVSPSMSSVAYQLTPSTIAIFDLNDSDTE